MFRFRGFLFVAIVFCFEAMFAFHASAATYYISPSGNNANAGTAESSPWKTFSKAFSTMAGGDELILLDGTYSESAGTGYMSYLGTNSAQPPSGFSTSSMTYVHAKNPGNVKIIGALFLGRSTRKDSYIKIQGMTFDSGTSGESALYNTSYVYIKDCGFHGTAQDGGGVFGIGTNDGSWGNSYDLIEDVWVWGKNRIIASNYMANNNVWRRVVVRGDGCSTSACSGSGNPNVGITVYNSQNISMQNIVVIDRILQGSGNEYADFATAQHSPGVALGPNEWLGTLSLNAPDVGYYFEADSANNNTATMRDIVAWGSVDDGVNIGAAYKGILLENITAGNNGGSNIRVAPEVTTGTVRNVVAYNAGLWGINSAIKPSYSDVYGSGSDPYNQTSCSVGCKTTSPLSDGSTPSLKYITRIETGSPLKGTGYGSADYGANIVNRYGAEGTFYGQTGYNVLTSSVLWPYSNEVRIKKEMCDDTGITRGFCSDSSLTHYIMNQLGNGNPYAVSSTPQPCSTVTTPTDWTNDPNHTGYGTPYDLFNNNTSIVQADCTQGSPTTLNLSIGNTTDPTLFSLMQGYYWNGSDWTPYTTSTCSGNQSGSWCQGETTGTITSTSINTSNSTTPQYFLGFTCKYTGSLPWKCGCQDTACTTPSWQLQGAALP